MPKAMVGDTIIAESDQTILIEGNHYFPPESIKHGFLSEPTDLHTICHWKGEASYRDVEVNGNILKNIAWFYPSPQPSAIEKVGGDFSNYIAFYPQVKIID
ncbi:MAG: DUF427 domain-containing protein [Candidatus Saccharimonadales bacterium]|nr:DUF427 domain-containing protein [Candidatus Saccharimonadales bacterium]